MVHVFNFCSWEVSDFSFPISGHLFLFTSRYCRLPQNQCSTFFHHFSLFYCTRYWYFSFWISFLALTFSSECCTICPTSITWQFLVFELLGDSCLEGLSIATTKSTPDGLLEKTLNGFITNRCIKFANYWRGIFSFIKFGFSWTELEWCGVGWKFLFRCCCS